jgi:hypothetical protein
VLRIEAVQFSPPPLIYLDERLPGRLKHSPGNFFVASIPSLLPIATVAGGVVEHVAPVG